MSNEASRHLSHGKKHSTAYMQVMMHDLMFLLTFWYARLGMTWREAFAVLIVCRAHVPATIFFTLSLQLDSKWTAH